jgi:Flp pilus assembly pilin Flp
MNELSDLIHSVKLASVVLKRDRSGVTAVEYALIAGALVAGIALAFSALTGTLKTYLGGLSFTD